MTTCSHANMPADPPPAPGVSCRSDRPGRRAGGSSRTPSAGRGRNRFSRRRWGRGFGGQARSHWTATLTAMSRTRLVHTAVVACRETRLQGAGQWSATQLAWRVGRAASARALRNSPGPAGTLVARRAKARGIVTRMGRDGRQPGSVRLRIEPDPEGDAQGKGMLACVRRVHVNMLTVLACNMFTCEHAGIGTSLVEGVGATC